jgi:hypothetical protein
LHFLNPFALLGLAAALIPLAIHLLHRGRSTPRPFSNLEFLRAVHQRRMRSVQLRQWLVLLLRTLALGLIAAAFARPTYRADWAAGVLGQRVPTTTVVLIDRSLSTDYRLPSGRVFTQLRDRALDLLNQLADQDDVTVIAFGEHADIVRGENLDQLRDAVAELTSGEEATNPAVAFANATKILEAKSLPNPELYILSDFVRRDWVEAAPMIRKNQQSDIRVYASPTNETAKGNTYIDTVAPATWTPAAGQPMAFQVSITNTHDTDIEDVPVDLYLDGERVQRQIIDLLPGLSTESTEFNVAVRHSGHSVGFVELEEDALSLDNRYYFTFHVPDQIKVLLVGPRSVDTYYLRRALTAVGGTDPVMTVDSRLVDELESIQLMDYDIVMLCNLDQLSRERTGRIHDYVEAGSALVIFPSSQADLNFYNRQLLPPLLPVSMVGVSASSPAQSYHLDEGRPFHPVLRGLWSSQRLDRPRFTASFDLAPPILHGTLAHFSDGRPALIESVNGGGRVVLFAVPLDLRWSDLPLKGLFVPLLQRLCRHLTQPSTSGRSYHVGEVVRRELKRAVDADRIQAESPSGRRSYLDAEISNGVLMWKIPRLDESGIWTLSNDGNVVDRFAVNVDRRESRLAPLPRELFADVFESTHLQLVEGGDLAAAMLANRYGQELWRELLMVALALLLMEQWLARAPRTAVPKS